MPQAKYIFCNVTSFTCFRKGKLRVPERNLLNTSHIGNGLKGEKECCRLCLFLSLLFLFSCQTPKFNKVSKKDNKLHHFNLVSFLFPFAWMIKKKNEGQQDLTRLVKDLDRKNIKEARKLGKFKHSINGISLNDNFRGENSNCTY